VLQESPQIVLRVHTAMSSVLYQTLNVLNVLQDTFARNFILQDINAQLDGTASVESALIFLLVELAQLEDYAQFNAPLECTVRRVPIHL